MPEDEIQIAKQWVAKADNDLLDADNNLKSEKIPYDTVCFHCQQAAEKILKAYLELTRIPIYRDEAESRYIGKAKAAGQKCSEAWSSPR